MPLLYRKKTLAVKTEATYGTAESLTSSEAIRVNDCTLKNAAELVAREKSDGTNGTDIGIPSGLKMELAFKNFAHGDAGSGDPAYAAALLPAVGMPSPSSNTYTTSSTTTNWKGMTAALNRDGRRLIGRGFMGNLKQTWEASKPVVFDWNFIGAVAANPTLRTDTTQLSGITFDGDDAPIFAGSGSLTIDGATTFKISKAEIDLNNNPYAREDPNAVGGYIGGYLTNPSPTIKLDVEAVAVATKDWHTFFYAATQFNVVLVANGGTGNTVTCTCTNCQLRMPPEESDRNNLLIDNLDCQINGTVSIAFS